jgi:hypothetical protein
MTEYGVYMFSPGMDRIKIGHGYIRARRAEFARHHGPPKEEYLWDQGSGQPEERAIHELLGQVNARLHRQKEYFKLSHPAVQCLISHHGKIGGIENAIKLLRAHVAETLKNRKGLEVEDYVHRSGGLTKEGVLYEMTLGGMQKYCTGHKAWLPFVEAIWGEAWIDEVCGRDLLGTPLIKRRLQPRCLECRKVSSVGAPDENQQELAEQ